MDALTPGVQVSEGQATVPALNSPERVSLPREGHGRVLPRPQARCRRAPVGIVGRLSCGFVPVARRLRKARRRPALGLGRAAARLAVGARRAVRWIRLRLEALPPRGDDALVHVPGGVVVHPRQVGSVRAPGQLGPAAAGALGDGDHPRRPVARRGGGGPSLGPGALGTGLPDPAGPQPRGVVRLGAPHAAVPGVGGCRAGSSDGGAILDSGRRPLRLLAGPRGGCPGGEGVVAPGKLHGESRRVRSGLGVSGGGGGGGSI